MKRLRLHYFLTDYYSGLIIIFLPLFFREIIGLNEIQVGLLYLLGSGIAVISSLLNAYIAQKAKSEKCVLAFLIAITFTLIIISQLLAGMFSVSILMIGLFLVRNVFYIIGDEITISYCNEHKEIDFGKIRSFGSLGWGANFLLNGLIYTLFPNYLIVMFIVVLIFMFINVLLWPNVNTDDKVIKINDVKEIFKYRNFLLFAILSIFMWGVLNNFNMYVEYAIKDIGGNLLPFYILNAFVLLIDFWVMHNSAKLIRKIKAFHYYILVILIMIFKLLIISLLFNYATALLTILFDPFFFGLYIPLIGTFVKAEMPKHLSTISLSIIPAFQNISVGLMAVLYGFLYHRYSYHAVFIVMLVIFVIILIIARKINFESVDNYFKKGEHEE